MKIFKKTDKHSFQTVRLEEECPQLTYEYSINRVGKFNLIDTLVISFKGKYRFGSAGRPDAGLMKGIIQLGVEVWDPFSLLIDLRELEYEWGDNIDTILGASGYKKTAILVSDKNRKALSTLFFGIQTDEDIVDSEFYFDDFDKAIEKIKRKN